MCHSAFASSWGVRECGCLCVTACDFACKKVEPNIMQWQQSLYPEPLKHTDHCVERHCDQNQSQESSKHRLNLSTQSNLFMTAPVLVLSPWHTVPKSMWAWHSWQGERNYCGLTGKVMTDFQESWPGSYFNSVLKLCLCVAGLYWKAGKGHINKTNRSSSIWWRLSSIKVLSEVRYHWDVTFALSVLSIISTACKGEWRSLASGQCISSAHCLEPQTEKWWLQQMECSQPVQPDLLACLVLFQHWIGIKKWGKKGNIHKWKSHGILSGITVLAALTVQADKEDTWHLCCVVLMLWFLGWRFFRW